MNRFLSLPDEVLEIILRLMVYEIHHYAEELKYAFRLREISRDIYRVITMNIFGNLKQSLSPLHIACYLSIEQLSLFKRLESLDLTYHDTIKGEFKMLTHLSSLSLPINMKNKYGDSLIGLTHLKSLSVASPSIELTQVIKTLTQLTQLSLNANLYLEDDTLTELPHLTSLSLEYDGAIKGILPSKPTTLSVPSLRVLRLCGRDTSLAIDAYKLLTPQLTSLILDSTVTLDHSLFHNMPSLTYLRIKDTYQTYDKALKRMTALTALSLEDASAIIDEESLEPLVNLQHLTVCNNLYLTPSILKYFVSSLTSLYVDDTNILLPDTLCLTRLTSLTCVGYGKKDFPVGQRKLKDRGVALAIY